MWHQQIKVKYKESACPWFSPSSAQTEGLTFAGRTTKAREPRGDIRQIYECGRVGSTYGKFRICPSQLAALESYIHVRVWRDRPEFWLWNCGGGWHRGNTFFKAFMRSVRCWCSWFLRHFCFRVSAETKQKLQKYHKIPIWVSPRIFTSSVLRLSWKKK